MIEKIEILEKESLGFIQKPLKEKFLMGLLAGCYIGFGAIFFLLLLSGGYSQLIASIGFCLGLVLVLIAKADLFTGSHLFIVSWLGNQLTKKSLLSIWFQLFCYNLIGSIVMALIFYCSKPSLEIESLIREISVNKVSLSFLTLFFRGILCNWLVCLAVWMCLGMKSISGKVLCILFPISAFVALGFEHSVANMFFLSFGFILGEVSLYEVMLKNLLPVTIGNFIGGGIFVGFFYFTIYSKTELNK